MKAVDRIGGPLRDFLRERGIISRCELLNRVYQFTREADLSPEEQEEIEKLVGNKQLAAGVFQNVVSGAPIFFDLPKLDTYTVMSGRLFHFLHAIKYGRQDFDNANRRLAQEMPALISLLIDNLAWVMTSFMERAGYKISGHISNRLIFEAGDKKIEVLVYSSANSVNIDDCKAFQSENCVMLIPSAENVKPFMKFYWEKGASAEEAGIQIWVVNLEKGTVDPFVGYTTDMDIYGQFGNPRLAEMVRTNWKAT
jgi:hypothetical protein